MIISPAISTRYHFELWDSTYRIMELHNWLWSSMITGPCPLRHPIQLSKIKTKLYFSKISHHDFPFLAPVYQHVRSGRTKKWWRHCNNYDFDAMIIMCGGAAFAVTDHQSVYFIQVYALQLKFSRKNTLQWRHNGHNGVSNHQPHNCLLNRLFRRRSKKTPKLRVTGLCVGNSPVTCEFHAQRASNVENVSIWWRHHEFLS